MEKGDNPPMGSSNESKIVPKNWNDHIKQFNPYEHIKDIKNFSMIVFGKTRTGKSVYVKDLMSKIKHFYKNVYVFSNTAHLQISAWDFVPSTNIFKGLDVATLEKLCREQETYIQRETRAGKDKAGLNHIMFIFDDIINNPKIRACETFNDLWVQQRHNNVAIIANTQYYSGKYGYNALARKNCNLFCTLFPESEIDQQFLAKEFLSVVNWKEGHEVLKQICLERYKFLIIANHLPCRTYEDYCFQYIANPNVRKFKVGEKDYISYDRTPMMDETKYEQNAKRTGRKSGLVINLRFTLPGEQRLI